MDYNTFKPSAVLSPFIKCFWTLRAPASSTPEKQRIVPDGCMELIFHCGDVYEQFLQDGSRILQPRSFVFGQISSPLEIVPTGASDIIAARFFPDGFAPFTSQNITEMENQAVPLHLLFGEEGTQLENRVMRASSTPQRIKWIESFLKKKLQGEEVVERMIRSGIEVLMRLKGQVTVDQLADQLRVSRRQLERKFSTKTGMSPKQLSKIIRLQSSLKLLEQKQFTNLTSLAYESGYFDQAHFIRDFKQFTGMSPKQFYADHLKLSALFIRQE